MIDLARSQFYKVEELSVAAGQTVNIEGAALQSVLESGEEVVYLATNGVAQTFAGISLATTITPTSTSYTQTITVPSAPGPYVVSLAKNNIVGTAGTNTGEIFIIGAVTGALANLTTAGPGGIAAGQYYADYAAGEITFNAAQAGESMTITYRYSLTVAEAIAQYYQGNVNNTAHQYYGKISIGKKPCRFYTDQFVGSVNWANVGAGTMKITTNGMFVNSAGTGTTLATARVIHVPNADIPMLGIAID